jgi:hypothetical protein
MTTKDWFNARSAVAWSVTSFFIIKTASDGLLIKFDFSWRYVLGMILLLVLINVFAKVMSWVAEAEEKSEIENKKARVGIK